MQPWPAIGTDTLSSGQCSPTRCPYGLPQRAQGKSPVGMFNRSLGVGDDGDGYRKTADDNSDENKLCIAHVFRLLISTSHRARFRPCR